MTNVLLAIWKFEWLLLKRNRVALLMLFFICATGIYAVQFGYHSIRKIQDQIAGVERANDSTRQEFLGYFSDKGTADSVRFSYRGMNSLYDGFTVEDYLQYNMAVNHPGKLTHLSLGQKDVYSPYRKVSARSLYYDGSGISLGDKYAEINNPHKQLAGNFDLAYWLLYLIPLFIIARNHNLFSESNENGTLPLLQQLPVSVRTITFIRLLYRCLGTLLLVSLFSLAGYLYSPIEASGTGAPFLEWMLVAMAYVIFWFALSWALISCRRSAASTALMMTGCWILFLFIIPGLVNNYISSRYPLGSRTALVDALNEKTATLWDMPDSIQQVELYKDFPLLATEPIKPIWTSMDSFDSLGVSEDADLRYNKRIMLWHYFLDKSVQAEVKAYEKQLEEKEKAAHPFAWIHPAMVAQRGLNLAAASGEDNRNAFRQSTALYRDSIFLMTITHVFKAHRLGYDDYAKYGKFSMPAHAFAGMTKLGIWVLLAYTGIFLLFGFRQFNRRA